VQTGDLVELRYSCSSCERIEVRQRPIHSLTLCDCQAGFLEVFTTTMAKAKPKRIEVPSKVTFPSGEVGIDEEDVEVETLPDEEPEDEVPGNQEPKEDPKPAPVPVERKGFALTNEMRAELIKRGCQDVEPNDPGLILVHLTELLMPKIAEHCAGEISSATQKTIEKMEALRQETLAVTADDMAILAERYRMGLKRDLEQADKRAAAIVQGIEGKIKYDRAFWVAVGAFTVVLLLLGVGIGRGIS
jgi:hypothetical protein